MTKYKNIYVLSISNLFLIYIKFVLFIFLSIELSIFFGFNLSKNTRYFNKGDMKSHVKGLKGHDPQLIGMVLPINAKMSGSCDCHTRKSYQVSIYSCWNSSKVFWKINEFLVRGGRFLLAR